ncbi:MAG: ferrous iron transport protein [Candidatus Methanomethylophilaceae archaeon]|nr:ferrous iron transport protein [Candidatus Methanomethylophilaceae archaeon]MDI3541914.1 ferrous iron transport protein [Candidatus Methanomethylophilaceae archaeon]
MCIANRVVKLALMGAPNVGKSTLFTKLTGVGVITSNYPGTTVEFEEGSFVRHNTMVSVHDLPGTYSLSGESEDEVVAIRMLAEGEFDTVLLVVDASRIESSLVLAFQLIELGYPIIIALNQMDIARRRYYIDTAKLGEILDVPIYPVVATLGEGVDELANAIVKGEARVSKFKVRYDSHIEAYIRRLEKDVESGPYPPRGAIIKMLEGNEYISSLYDNEVRDKIYLAAKEFQALHGEPAAVHINRDRFGEAGRIRKEVIEPKDVKPSFSDRLSDITVQPLTGIPILMGVLATVFLSIVYLGQWLEQELESIFNALVGDVIIDLGSSIAGELGASIGTGITMGFEAILVLIVPYVMVWYAIMAFLEDSGYMPRAVALLDGVMHHVGLHGRAIIPMLVGIGCSVPAIMATRTAGSKRERLILSILIVMAVPCGAQLAIILGFVSRFAGIGAAAGIFAILLGLLLFLGLVMDRWLRKEPTTLAMEIPDLRRPAPRNILFKTYSRSKDFFVIAFPLMLVGSIILEILLYYNTLDFLVEPMSFITVGILGLPAITIIAFIFGILRKELAVGMLVTLFGATSVYDLANYMTPDQVIVFGVVMAIYMPCVATWAVLMKEIGVKNSIFVGLASVTVSIIIGGVVNLLLSVV